MEGYRNDTYGEGFADVYDDWYGDVSPVDATVDFVQRRHPALVVELGSGTGRLAGPLAATGIAVVGLDASAAMLTRSRTGHPDVPVVRADMTAPPLAAGSADVVLVAFNTLFNVDDDGQRACLTGAAALLTADGVLVVEAFVPGAGTADASERVDVARLDADVVVLRVSRSVPDPDGGDGVGTVVGSHVELRDGAPVRLRPWQVRYRSPASLDTLAAEAGLTLTGRFAGWDEAAFTADSPTHVSVYRRDPTPQ